MRQTHIYIILVLILPHIFFYLGENYEPLRVFSFEFPISIPRLLLSLLLIGILLLVRKEKKK